MDEAVGQDETTAIAKAISSNKKLKKSHEQEEDNN